MSQSMPEISADLRELASECTANARMGSTNPNAVSDPNAALAVKNWAGAALSAVQASLTATRGADR